MNRHIELNQCLSMIGVTETTSTQLQYALLNNIRRIAQANANTKLEDAVTHRIFQMEHDKSEVKLAQRLISPVQFHEFTSRNNLKVPLEQLNSWLQDNAVSPLSVETMSDGESIRVWYSELK
jgi:hypothetical protein